MTVIEETDPYIAPSGGVHKRYLCKCDCGTEKAYLKEHLTSGRSKSCGCMQWKPRGFCEWHDVINTRIYRIWGNMVNRCSNENNPNYHSYGGRGIKVCDEWLSFPEFYKWALESGYDKSLTIDRIDNDDGYYPENCRWATVDQQANNKRSNKFITYNGETHTIAEWAKILGVKYKALHSRLSLGWTVERAFTQEYRCY